MDAVQHRSIQELDIAEAGPHPRFSNINTSNNGLLDPHPRFSDYQYLSVGDSERSSTATIYNQSDIRTSAYSDRIVQRGSQATIRSDRWVSAIYEDSLTSRDSGSIGQSVLRRTVLYDNAPGDGHRHEDDDSPHAFSGRESLRYADHEEASDSKRQDSLPSSNTPKPPLGDTRTLAGDTVESLLSRLYDMQKPFLHAGSGPRNVRDSLDLLREREDHKQDFGLVMQELREKTSGSSEKQLEESIEDFLTSVRQPRDNTPDSLSPTGEFSAPSQSSKALLTPKHEPEENALKRSSFERRPEHHIPDPLPATAGVTVPLKLSETVVSHADLKEHIDVYPFFSCARIIRRVVHKHRLDGIWTDYSLYIQYDGTQEELVDLDEPPGMSVDAMASQGRKPEYVLRMARREGNSISRSVNMLDVAELKGTKEAAEEEELRKIVELPDRNGYLWRKEGNSISRSMNMLDVAELKGTKEAAEEEELRKIVELLDSNGYL